MTSTDDHIRRIRECMPALEIRHFEAITDGLENDIAVVNEQLVFRFPKTTAGVDRLSREVAISKVVARHTDMRIPQFIHVEDDFVAYEKIAGVALHRDVLLMQPEAVQDRAAEALARFLCQLHAIPASELQRNGIGTTPAPGKNSDWVRLYEQVRELLFPQMARHVQECVERHFRPLLEGTLDMEDYEPVLVHADLGYYHVLFDEEAGRITGVLDFGCAGLGDPAVDFGIVLHVYGEQFLRRMSPYDSDIARCIDRSRFGAGTGEMRWAATAVKLNKWSWFMYHLSAARDINPVGSPFMPQPPRRADAEDRAAHA
jgi:aminoglycoside 2''-phosphotransferase